MALSLARDKVAVKVTSVEEFSSILSALKAKVTEGGSSLSVNAKFIAEVDVSVALTAVVGVTIMVSSASSIVSSIPEIVKVPVVEPAGMVI